MKNLIMTAIICLTTTSAFADHMQCAVQKMVGSAMTTLKVVNLEKTDAAHGSVEPFSLPDFGGISGMIAWMKPDMAIISLYSDELSVGSSSHSSIANGLIAYHQMILPHAPGQPMNGLVVQCAYTDVMPN